MQNTKTIRLVETGLLLAIATVLSLIKPFELPFGGGITIISMLPIVLIAYKYGTKWGLFSAFVGSILQILTSMKTVSAFFLPGESHMVLWKAILICFIDYIIAYTALGFGGIFRNKFKSPSTALCLGSIVALSLRYLAHIISGVIFFGSYAEWFFTQEGFYKIGNTILNNFSGNGLVIIYSLFYNGLFMIPEIIITAVAALIIGKVPQITKKND